MRHRKAAVTVAAVAALIAGGIATAALAATPTADPAALKMPLIGSGTHPVTPEEPSLTVDSWGVGNG